MPFDHDELSVNANGGTELMGRGLAKHLPASYLDKVHIIRSRVRTISPTLPNILWLHDLPEDPEVQRLCDPAYRKQFAKLVFVSRWQQEQYNRLLGVPFRDGVVIRNAVEYVDPVQNKVNPAEQLRLIYHTTPHRGLVLLAPMMEALLEDFPDANIRLDVFSSFKAYGWEERDKPYQALFERLEAHPWIHYHGWQPNNVVLDCLKEAHAFVYPSIWPETSCIAAIEAMAHGCRVLTTSLGALPETLQVDPSSAASITRYSTDTQEMVDDFYHELHSYVKSMTSGVVESGRRWPVHAYPHVMNTHAWPTIAEQWKRLIAGITA